MSGVQLRSFLEHYFPVCIGKRGGRGKLFFCGSFSKKKHLRERNRGKRTQSHQFSSLVGVVVLTRWGSPLSNSSVCLVLVGWGKRCETAGVS